MNDPRAGWVVGFIAQMDRELDAYAATTARRIAERGQPLERCLDELIGKISERPA